MILLDGPYVSKHFLNYLERSGQPVLETPFTARLAHDYGLNLVDDAEAEKRCRNGERLYRGHFKTFLSRIMTQAN